MTVAKETIQMTTAIATPTAPVKARAVRKSDARISGGVQEVCQERADDGREGDDPNDHSNRNPHGAPTLTIKIRPSTGAKGKSGQPARRSKLTMA